MESATEKFDAAVSVIRNLPKNGPFQPSYDMMKRFYGLFKQATEGPCTQAKPAFWNVVQTQKWQAWSVLGDMSSLDAKTLYVEELLKIIETVPQTDDVVGFLQTIGPFFELVTEKEAAMEQKMTSAPKVNMVNGHANGEVKMRTSGVSDKGDYSNGLSNGVSGLPNGHLEDGHEVGRGSGDDAEMKNGLTDSTTNESEEDREEMVETEAEGKEKTLVLVESSHQGDDSADLSHPILISKSQLEAVEETLPTSSESESDGDEFCDSIDEPLINSIKINHTSNTESFPPIIEEGLEENRLTSTPFNAENSVVTEAQVHNNVDAVITPHYTTSSSSAPPPPSPSHRGGGEVTNGSKGQQGHGSSGQSRDQSGQGSSNGNQSGSYPSGQSHQSQDGVDGAGRGAGGGRGRKLPGGGSSPRRSPIPDDVVEQIMVSLERLQRDMNSVLVRLNTLETIAISRHQIETQQAYMRDGVPHPEGGLPARPRLRSPSWWPFPTLPSKTVFVFLVWPFIVQWLIRFLARHRKPRPRP